MDDESSFPVFIIVNVCSRVDFECVHIMCVFISGLMEGKHT